MMLVQIKPSNVNISLKQIGVSFEADSQRERKDK